jgi:hypothetical protein
MAEDVDNFLEHYGVKGMRWGKRSAGQALADSAFGRMAQKNVDRHNQRKYGTSKVLKKDSAKSEKYFSDRNKARTQKKEARAQGDRDILAARQRVQSGKNLATRMLNQSSFGRPLGGKQVVSLLNPGNSPEDVATASRMTRGEKAVAGVLIGGSLVLNVAARAAR